jgi:hypothetical protein
VIITVAVALAILVIVEVCDGPQQPTTTLTDADEIEAASQDRRRPLSLQTVVSTPRESSESRVGPELTGNSSRCPWVRRGLNRVEGN